jgi:hypothetical protein
MGRLALFVQVKSAAQSATGDSEPKLGSRVRIAAAVAASRLHTYSTDERIEVALRAFLAGRPVAHGRAFTRAGQTPLVGAVHSHGGAQHWRKESASHARARGAVLERKRKAPNKLTFFPDRARADKTSCTPCDKAHAAT